MTVRLSGVGVVHPGGRRALAAVDLAVAAGERVALIGPSGAGKTTLLRVAGAALRPNEGRVELLGEDPWALGAGALRRLRARIGAVHQSPPLPPRQRVVTAVLAGRLGQWTVGKALWSLVQPADTGGAHEALDRLGLADRLFDRCDRLSGGQLQRVAVARVLYQRPDLLLADEPVSSLDPATSELLVSRLAAQSEATGAALVASLHAVDLALKWFPRVVGVRAGRVMFDLPAGEVSPALLQALYEGAEGDAVPASPSADGSTLLAAPTTMCR
ncbi:MAG: ATP-binding cassette domain-containing protein [Rhizobacter sp.]